MYLHANAKLGLAAPRFALVQAVAWWLFDPGCGSAVQRLACDGSSVVASLALGGRGSAGDALVSVRPFQPSAPLSASTRSTARGGDLCLPPSDRLGAEAGRGCNRVPSLDRLEGAEAGRDLAATP